MKVDPWRQETPLEFERRAAAEAGALCAWYVRDALRRYAKGYRTTGLDREDKAVLRAREAWRHAMRAQAIGDEPA